MTYTPKQALAVALYNAGITEGPGKGIPMTLADQVLAGLTQMGFRLDGTEHEVALAMNSLETYGWIACIKCGAQQTHRLCNACFGKDVGYEIGDPL